MSKKVRTALVAAIATLSASAGMAETMNMDVKAAVTGTCKMVVANALDFGNLDPTTSLAVTGKSTTVQYLCTKGKTPTSLTIGGGTGSYTGAMAHTSGDTIPFSLSWNPTLPAGQGMGAGKEVSLTVNGDIAAGTYFNVTAGNYLKTLVVELTP